MSVRNPYLSTLAFAALLILSGCATMETTQSGFLTDYQELESDEETPNHREFIAENIDWTRFSAAKIESVKAILPAKQAKRFDKEDIAQLEADAEEILREVFASRLAPSDASGQEKLCIRAAITDINTVNVGMNTVTSILAVPLDNGGVSVEIEILDAASRERLLAYSSYETGKMKQVGGFFSKLGHAKSGFRKIAQRASDAIQN